MKRALIVALALMAAIIGGCNAQQQPTTVTPGSPIPGYYTAGQQLQGGSEAGELLNLKRTDAAINGSETLISLSFVLGSERAGDSEQPMNEAPAYQIEALQGPGRLMLTLPIAYADYQGSEPEPAGLYTAMYALEDGEGNTRLYLQFTGKVGFRVDEQKGALILHIEPENPDPDERYYVMLDYADATLAAATEAGMHPVICEDGETMIFLSPPFETNAQADDLAASLNAKLDAAEANHRAAVDSMQGNWAPTYKAGISRDELQNMGALLTPQGEELSASPMAVGARFLAWRGDGTALCAQPVSRDEGAESTEFEQLWIFDAQGNRQRYTEREFAYIDRAAFSRDGRYLAFIERVEAKRLLYFYDPIADTLDFLSAEGMGDFTASFDWSEDGKLYALSGTETMQLMCFDPSLDGDTDRSRVSAVEERYGGAGSVYCAGDKVYTNGDVAGVIMQVDPLTGEREEFALGDGFSISPDGNTMLISYYDPLSGIDSQTGVKVRDMQTGDEIELTQGLTYHGSAWSLDSGVLSYLVGNQQRQDVFGEVEPQESPADEPDPMAAYPARLYTFAPSQGVVALRGVLASDLIYPGRNANEVILVAYHRYEDGTQLPVTYRLALP